MFLAFIAQMVAALIERALRKKNGGKEHRSTLRGPSRHIIPGYDGLRRATPVSTNFAGVCGSRVTLAGVPLRARLNL